jgi:hypothetical protein
MGSGDRSQRHGDEEILHIVGTRRISRLSSPEPVAIPTAPSWLLRIHIMQYKMIYHSVLDNSRSVIKLTINEQNSQ